MAGPEQIPETTHWLDRLASLIARNENGRVNRRLLGAAGMASIAGAATLGSQSSRVRGAQKSDTEAVLADAVTAEGLLVTLLGVARTRANDLRLDEATVRLIRAAQCEEEAHFNNLVSAGAAPITGSYSIADQIFENPTSFLTTWTSLERIMVGMYLAASRHLAANGAFDLVEMSYQIGVVEAQHLALLRQLSGERLPADRAFAEWQFATTAKAMDEIDSMGFIDGKGTSYDYPGPGDRYCRGVTGLVAETTADQTPPDVTPGIREDATPAETQDQATPVSDS